MLYCLTQQPKLIRSEWVSPDWFDYKPYQTLVKYLNDVGGELDYIQLRDGFTKSYPGVMSREDWEPILTADVTVGNFSSWVKVIRNDFYRKRAQESAFDFANDPSDEKFHSMLITAQDAISNDSSDTEVTMDELVQDMHERITEGKLDVGIKTYAPIDKLFGDGLMPGRLITIGARPAVGKSAFAINLVLEAFKRQADVTIDVFSLEMTNRQNYQRLVASMTGIPSSKLVNPMIDLSDAEMKKVEEAGQTLRSYDLRLWDKQLKLQQIVKVLRQRAATAKHGYLAVVDYLGLIEVPGQPDRRLQIEEVTRQFKLLTNELDVPIIMLSQLSRGIESRNDKKPMLSDLRESGSIEQDSNAVGFLWNSDRSNEKSDVRSVTLTIAKNREGALGDVNFNFFANKLQFRVAYLT